MISKTVNVLQNIAMNKAGFGRNRWLNAGLPDLSQARLSLHINFK